MSCLPATNSSPFKTMKVKNIDINIYINWDLNNVKLHDVALVLLRFKITVGRVLVATSQIMRYEVINPFSKLMQTFKYSISAVDFCGQINVLLICFQRRFKTSLPIKSR
jgi:hypothetical protein